MPLPLDSGDHFRVAVAIKQARLT